MTWTRSPRRFRYLAAPRDRSFVPLDFDRPMTMEQILTDHPKGVDYAHLVRDFPRFPLIVDSRDQVLSFPPIINGELTRVTGRTRNILLDTTGTDLRAVMTAVKILCAALARPAPRWRASRSMVLPALTSPPLSGW